MAGNNCIQFLRGTEAQRQTHTETSLAGQPIFTTDENQLFVGNGSDAVKGLQPVSGMITTSKLDTTKSYKITSSAYN